MFRRSAVLLAILGLLLAACGGGATAEERVRIEMTATEFKFEPATWEIPAGKLVKVVVHNKGVVEHDFTITDLKVAVKALAGKDTTKDFASIAAGTYEVFCSVAGHKESGMVGKLIVK